MKLNVPWSLLLMGVVSLPVLAQNSFSLWVETFEASPATYDGLPIPKEAMGFTGPVTGTLRYRFGISVGGSRLIVRLSNELGSKALKIAGASIAIAGEELNAAPGKIRRLTFGGKESLEIPPGALMLSDPVELEVAGMTDLLCSVFVTEPIELAPMGGASMTLTEGDSVLSEKIADVRKVKSRPIVTSVLVTPAHATRVVVALGDSITDGVRDNPSEPHGWVATLAARMTAEKKSGMAVVSAGISGNRILKSMMGPAALARIDRDVFSVPGLACVVLLEGINDIGFSGKTPFGTGPELPLEDLLNGYKQIALRAHARGVKIFAGTLLAAEGAFYFSDDKERLRQAVNAWIRNSKEFDGVIDFDAVIRDPGNPTHMKADFDSGDHLHPNAAGYRAMGEAIDLSMFR